MKKIWLLYIVFVFTVLFFANSNLFADEQDLTRIEELSALCAKNLEAALLGGRKSQVRQDFESNLKELRFLCAKVQKDIDKYKLGITLIHDTNFINESFENIKKMKELATTHHLFHDMTFVFTEFDYKLKDLRKTGLYLDEEPKPLERKSDYLLELAYLLDKLSKQEDDVTFYKIKGSRTLELNRGMVTRIQFLAGKAQNAVNKVPDNKIPPIAADANTMLQMYNQIINNITDKNPKAIQQWNKALQNLNYAVDKAIEADIKAPVK